MRYRTGFACAAAAAFSVPASAEVIVDFEEAEVGMLVEVWEEEGVTFTLASPGLLSFQQHPSGNLGIFEAIADVDIPIRADLPVVASSVSVVFFNTTGDFPTLRAFDSDGALVAEASAPGLSDPFAFLELTVPVTVSAPEIASVEITGVGSADGVLIADELRFTPIPSPGVLCALAIPLLTAPRSRRRPFARGQGG